MPRGEELVKVDHSEGGACTSALIMLQQPRLLLLLLLQNFETVTTGTILCSLVQSLRRLFECLNDCQRANLPLA